MKKPFVHDDPDWPDLISIVSCARNVVPGLVEKDYWIMHVLWSLSEVGLHFYLKGGTSLSKGFQIIDRFSEDIDVLIEDAALQSRTARTDTSPTNVKKRADFFNRLCERIRVEGSTDIFRDSAFDDEKLRSAGIRIAYVSIHPIPGIKDGVLLEAGVDDVEPFEKRTISSWVLDHVEAMGRLSDYRDNRAVDVKCYRPEYTFVEKLQTVSTKYRQFATGEVPQNFARHYYDIYKLLGLESVQQFIGTRPYLDHKARRFRENDVKDLTKNEAFTVPEADKRREIGRLYEATRALYYAESPSLEAILERIASFPERL